MARKVFISFLGYTNYGNCKYVFNDYVSDNLRFIQEATLDYLVKKESWGGNDVAYILLTNGAKEKNWLDDGQKNPKTEEIIKQQGLQSRLKCKEYPFVVKPIENIPDGKTEEELLEIFKMLYNVLEPNDTLYFDITHGFRSLPMLALVLINYAKFLLNIEVKSITYGNYEARTNDGSTFKAPVIDLLQLSQIQDWTFAIADFLKNGNADRFAKLADAYKKAIYRGAKNGDKTQAEDLNGLAQRMNKVIDDFQTCRGINILNSKNIKVLKESMSKVGETVVEPLNPIIEKVNDAFSVFEEDSEYSIRNGFEAAKWCINHNLYQQAVTILQENVVTFFCMRHGLNIYDDKERSYVNQVFRAKQDSYSSTPKGIKCNDTIPQTLLEDPLVADKDICYAFSSISEERNDINHEGMRNSPHESKIIRNNIKQSFDRLYRKIVLEESKIVSVER